MTFQCSEKSLSIPGLWPPCRVTGRRTDTIPIHRPCSTYYAGSATTSILSLTNVNLTNSHMTEWLIMISNGLQSIHNVTRPQKLERNSISTKNNLAIFRLLTHISAKCAHRIFFPHKLAFSTTILMLLVFLLPISIRFRYLVTIANRMAPSTCPAPVERDGVVGFKQFCTILLHISAAHLVFSWSAYFLNVA